MAVHRTTFAVAASAERVWEVLTGFDRYPDWNSSVPSITGDARVGSTISLRLAMPGRPSPEVSAEIVDAAPPRRLAWHGNVGADWLFAGDREFLIDAQPDGSVSVTHVEDLRGVLSPVFRAVMGNAIQRHHDGFNDCLKQRAESQR